MGERYAATGVDPIVTIAPGDTVLTVHSNGTTKRGKLYELIFSIGDTPADNIIQWLVRRCTALGTEGAAVVPAPLGVIPAPAAILDAGEAYTVEPTYTAATELLDFDLNQRATFRWVATTDGAFGIPAIANAGIGITPIGAGVPLLPRITAQFEE